MQIENLISSKSIGNHCSNQDVVGRRDTLLIGDLVEDNNKRCGTLQFDDYTKRYVIKGIEGGNVHTSVFIKIPELYEFKIDAGRVECRTPDKYLKRRW